MKLSAKRSLLVNYLATNLSVAVLACAVVGLILFSFAITQLNRAYEQEQIKRLRMAADDLQRQEQVLEDNSLDIRFDEIYRPAWFGRDATYEVEMVKQLAKYEGTSPLIHHFFLLYRGTENVYYPQRKNYFPIYMVQLGITEGIETLYDQIVSVQDSSLIVHQDGRAFLCYNLPMSKQTAIGDAVLVYLLDRGILLERLETVMGLRADSLFVYYGGYLLSADEGPDIASLPFAQGIFKDEQYLAAQSADGMFVVLSPVAANAPYALLVSFRTACLWIFAAFTLLMVLISCFTAYRNYRPIGKLLRYYAPNFKRDNNELEQINKLLSSSLESREKAQTALVQQMDDLEAQRLQIRRQLLLLLLSGNWEIPQNEILESGRLPLPMPSFGLLALRLLAQTNVDALCEMIEEMSGDDMLLYATPLPDTPCVVVLVNSEEKALLSLAADLIEGVRDASNTAFVVLPGETCDHVGDLSSALVRIFTQSPGTGEGRGMQISCDREMEKIVAWIRTGETEEALLGLESLLTELPGAYPSLMIRRYLYLSIFSLLTETAQQEGIVIDQQKSIPFSLTTKEPELRLLVLTLAREICAQQERKEDAQSDVRELMDNRTLAYIDENLLDWNLTLDSVSEAIGVSTRQLGRILRRCKNMTYKEYVTSMRMERAKALLTQEDLSVTETSQQVCYASVSHFIKTFRQYTGMTPANYKLLAKCGADGEA